MRQWTVFEVRGKCFLELKLLSIYFSNNYACDGVPGCPEGKDELGCLETTQIDDSAEALRVKTPEGKWQLVCFDSPDQVQFELANLACYQLGYWSAESFPAVPYSATYGQTFSKMVKPLDEEHRYLQGTMDHQARTCSYIWNLKCVHYECGKRQVKFRAQTRIVGGNR